MVESDADHEVQLDEAFLIVPDAAVADTGDLVDALNLVYSAESCSLFRYLETWSPYTNAQTIALRSACRRMMRRSFEHSDVLAHLIKQANGVTIMGAFAESDSSLNDTGWAYLVPRLIKTKQDMCSRYERAIHVISTMGGGVDADVVPTLERLLEENQADLAELESWRARLSG